MCVIVVNVPIAQECAFSLSVDLLANHFNSSLPGCGFTEIGNDLEIIGINLGVSKFECAQTCRPNSVKHLRRKLQPQLVPDTKMNYQTSIDSRKQKTRCMPQTHLVALCYVSSACRVQSTYCEVESLNLRYSLFTQTAKVE